MLRPPKVKYVASKRSDDKIGSRMIAWGTKQLEPDLKPCSHLAIVVRDTLVVESTLTSGVRIIPYSKWLEYNEEVYAFEKPYEGSLSAYLPSILDRLWGRSYDYCGVMYFAWRIALNKLFRIKVPKENKWESSYKRFCVEVFGEKLSMTSPIQMVRKWIDDPEMIELKRS